MEDFRYSAFWISKDCLKSYIEGTIVERKIKRKDFYNSNTLLTASIIACIANNDYEFDASDKETANTLQDLIEMCGMDEKGIYTDAAHRAMRNLCVMRGMKPDAIKLQDKTNTTLWERTTNKVKGFFGWGKKREAQQNSTEARTERLPLAMDTFRRERITLITAATASIVIMCATVAAGMSLSRCSSLNNDGNDDQTKQKTQQVLQKPNTDTLKIQPLNTYNKDWKVVRGSQPASMSPKPSITPMVEQKLRPTPTTEQMAEIARINACCNSSLNILIGQNARDKLYNQIRKQVERGIFQIPDGMSVERVAHAMTMSRIYEGKSVILDALNSEQKLNNAQQQAFAKYIEEIGVNGVGLQKRMAAKQKLSSHSKYDQASKSMKATHAKNLKQLRQMRAHTK